MNLSLLTCWIKKTLFKSRINLFSYIIITITKWNYLNIDLTEAKEMKLTKLISIAKQEWTNQKRMKSGQKDIL